MSDATNDPIARPAINDPHGVRSLAGLTHLNLTLFFDRINELQHLQERRRPVVILWQETEREFAEIAAHLVAHASQADLVNVITLLAMEAACGFGTSLEDGSYGEE